jgi:hypothetical protein
MSGVDRVQPMPKCFHRDVLIKNHVPEGSSRFLTLRGVTLTASRFCETVYFSKIQRLLFQERGVALFGLGEW